MRRIREPPPAKGLPALKITDVKAILTAPANIRVYNPAFDVTPARLIRAIITERGIIEPVGRETIAAMLGR